MVFDDALNQVKSGLGGQVKQQILGVKKPVGKSIGFLKQINPFEKKDSAEQKSGQKAEATDSVAQKANEDIVKGLYAPSAPEDKDKPQSKETEKLLKDNKDKSPEELQKLMALRNQLHQTQVAEIFRPPSARPEEQQAEQERPADRIARLHQEDLQKKQQEEEKKKPIAVDRAETARERKSAGAG